jgi:N12 class adenine-specific DNA methylase
MWRAAERLGFAGGTVLEPGCGSGNFLGFAPDGVRLVGVELDPTTAAIARHLYGSRATIHTAAFEQAPLAEDTFDLVIGNVPFAKVTPHDPRHNRGRHSLHNYFLLKSLALTRPGGLVLALTSRYTLDAQNPAARHALHEHADLVDALRLPARAFAASSGTDVVVDLLVLRRREPGRTHGDTAWLDTAPAGLDGDPTVQVNRHYLEHPDRVLGQLDLERGMYRDGELTVTPTQPLDDLLPAAIDALTDRALAHDLGLRNTATSAAPEPPGAPEPAGTFDTRHGQEGSYVVDPRTGRTARIVLGDTVAYEPRFSKDSAELVRLIGLRDATRAVLAAQVQGRSDTDVGDAQSELADRYAAYVRIYGPLNRSTTARTGRSDPDTGEDILRRLRPRMGGFRDDPDWPLVAALEVFDESTQQAQRAAIFTQRIIDEPRSRNRADTPADAVAICLDETGTITLERAAQLLSLPQEQARAALGTLVYDDPSTTSLVPASTYLAGNIRQKLAAARPAAATDPRYLPNIAALEAAMPRQLQPGEITARPGASWIPASDVEAFCREVLDAHVDVEHLADVGSWTTSLRSGGRHGVALSSEWGTARADAVTLLDAALNQRLHTVTDPAEDGRRIRNDPETLAARDKQEALATRFSEWVWEDPSRSGRLADRYNELFCSVALATYDGSHLTLPGLTATFHPRQHQVDAVARILTDGRGLLAHAVGAGKTATMVIAAMEQRRLGHVAKPAIVVPNHMLEQFSREWLQLYPLARILVADRDSLAKDRRKEFVARAATGDWDGIVFSQSSFAHLPLSTDTLRDYLGGEIGRARAALNASHDGKALSVKKLERRIAQLEETHKRLLAETTKDDGVTFEETGIDYLYVDEAHIYKNRRVDSSIDGVAKPGSQRAQDLDAKLFALRHRHGDRIAAFATATPVANSMIELWVMETYLHPDTLEQVGLRTCDAWAATFGRTHTALELAPDGASYRMQTRFARFQNVPELLGLYRQIADVRTTEDLALPTPGIEGGHAAVVIVEPAGDLVDFVTDLAERAERIRNRAVPPDEDNMLKVTGDGRRAALDLRLVGIPQPEGTGKLHDAARRIARIHHDTRTWTYADATGQLALRPGALQLVFCDVSTPAAAGWNAYDELRDLLVARGVARDTIRYMQHATTDQAKAALFQACRDGTVAVLIGSTETMGVGTNVQARAVALHHLDAPWRPADIEQRDGRILRQGNLNAEVQVVRYATEGSFDVYMWQTLERKAAFIGQVTRGDLPDRDVDDIGDHSLSYAEVKALASGNPLVLERATLQADIARLSRLEHAHHRDQTRLRSAIDRASRTERRATQTATELGAILGTVTDTRGDRFHIDTPDGPITTRPDAGRHLQSVVTDLVTRPPGERDAVVGTLGGLELHAIVDSTRTSITIGFPAIDTGSDYDADEWAASDPVAVIRRAETILQRLPSGLERATTTAASARQERERAASRLDSTFEHAPQLRDLRRRLERLDETLQSGDQTPATRQTLTADAPSH